MGKAAPGQTGCIGIVCIRVVTYDTRGNCASCVHLCMALHLGSVFIRYLYQYRCELQRAAIVSASTQSLVFSIHPREVDFQKI